MSLSRRRPDGTGSKSHCDRIGKALEDDHPLHHLAGPGNNGGDALAVSRMLAVEQKYDVSVYLFNINGNLSEDCKTNKQRLIECRAVRKFDEVVNEFDSPKLEKNMLVIDGLFGSGLNKPLAGALPRLSSTSISRLLRW